MAYQPKNLSKTRDTSDTVLNVAAAPSSEATGFAAKAKDLQALRDAFVDAASVGSGLWLSYVFVLLYLAVAASSVTHRDLFFENPVKLPFLTVDLPLLGFFGFGPALLLMVHVYVLLHFALLAGKVGAFHTELEAQIADTDTRASLRRQLPSNIFVQFLAGPREIRDGVIGFLLKLVAWISLIASPVALLMFFQLQFLPYHHPLITWWHRIAVVIDLVLLWLLWPPMARGQTVVLTWQDFKRPKIAAWTIASLLPVLLVFTIATFPGEWLEDALPTVRLVPTTLAAWQLPSVKEMQATRSGWATLHELLVAGQVNEITQQPSSLLSNRLLLPGIDVIDYLKFDTEDKISAHPITISLRGRQLQGAVMPEAKLRKADFTGAQLKNGFLFRADLREAKFDCGSTGAPEPTCTDLRGTVLQSAQLQGASLKGALLTGAALQNARLEGASLNGAQLGGAGLAGARFQGAWLDGAQLQGASLSLAQLRGAMLIRAQLEAADLRGAQLQGAALDQAQLHGAWLAQPPFLAANLQGASLDHVFVWRADVWAFEVGGARIIAPEIGPKYQGLDCPRSQTCDWSPDTFAALKRLFDDMPILDRQIPLSRIAKLNPAEKLDWSPQTWIDLGQLSPPQDYEEILAEILRQIGCDASGAPYVIHGLTPTLRLRFKDHSQAARLAATFLDVANCPGARGLSEQDKLDLRQLASLISPGPMH
jgi:uncharacterized protein YjbI with pentapeptide repeats